MNEKSLVLQPECEQSFRKLKEYRKKCEQELNYLEAKKALDSFQMLSQRYLLNITSFLLP